jgi:chromosome segregation ATPase
MEEYKLTRIYVGTSVPPNTSVVWYDTANKNLKAYIDGEWKDFSNPTLKSEIEEKVSGDITVLTGVVEGLDTYVGELKTLTASQGEAIAANSTRRAAYAGEVVALKGSLASTDAKVEQNKTDIAGLNTTVSDHGTRLTAVETKASTNEGAIAQNKTDIAAVKATADQAEVDISGIKVRVTALEYAGEAQDEVIGGISSRLATYAGEVVSLKSRVDNVTNASLSYKVVSELPEVSEADKNVVYLVPNATSEDKNTHDEYLFYGSKFELIGTSVNDFSDYYTKGEVDAAVKVATDAAAANAQEITDIKGTLTTHATEYAELKAQSDQNKTDIAAVKTTAEAADALSQTNSGLIAGLDERVTTAQGKADSAYTLAEGKVAQSAYDTFVEATNAAIATKAESQALTDAVLALEKKISDGDSALSTKVGENTAEIKAVAEATSTQISVSAWRSKLAVQDNIQSDWNASTAEAGAIKNKPDVETVSGVAALGTVAKKANVAGEITEVVDISSGTFTVPAGKLVKVDVVKGNNLTHFVITSTGESVYKEVECGEEAWTISSVTSAGVVSITAVGGSTATLTYLA